MGSEITHKLPQRKRLRDRRSCFSSQLDKNKSSVGHWIGLREDSRHLQEGTRFVRFDHLDAAPIIVAYIAPCLNDTSHSWEFLIIVSNLLTFLRSYGV